MQAQGEAATRHATIAGAPGASKTSDFHRPGINSQYFYVLGDRGFPLPNWPDSTKINCEIRWVGFPPSWQIVDSYGVARGVQRFATSKAELRKAVFVGGDFRVQPVSKAVPGLHLVTRGSWRFADESIAKMLDRLYQTDRSIWRDEGLREYFVWMFPTDDSGPHEGESRTNGLVFYGGVETKDLSDFAFLLSHELFHAWNPHRLSPPDFDEQLYWFTEGVTDFYAAVTLFRARIWDFEQLVSKFNAVCREYYDSPERNLPSGEMVVKRRTSVLAERLPYQQGFLLGANWNMRIRDHSGAKQSLDNALRQLERTSGTTLTASRIMQALSSIGLSEANAEIEDTILRGGTISLSPSVLGNCVSETIASAGFDIGFDYEKSAAASKVINVKTDSAAYDSGLRDGQAILSRDVVLGDPGYQARLEVEDQRGRRWIAFYAVSRHRVSIPQFRLDKSGDTCTGFFR
jgi:predicted metalloprotease with PDZ domain